MIEIKNLSFSRPTKTIFTNFNASLQSNMLTLLTGLNGSGKTTLINLIGGSLSPHSGCITINGLDIAHLSAREQSRLRSVAPQRRIFDLAFTVDEILSLLPAAQHSTHEADVRDALELNEMADLKVTELSLGQQQRVSVGLALIQEASFYLLDEPLSAQDSAHHDRTLDLLAMVAKEHGVLVVAHNSDSFSSRFGARISVSG